MDCVFIVTPDNSHCEVAQSWLKRLSPNGKGFIEKPLDSSPDQAEELRKHTRKGKDNVFVFDHYLAKAYPFFRIKNDLLNKAGNVRKIYFNILENSKIPSHREKTLDKGVI